MTGGPLLLGGAPRPDPARVRAIKALIAEELRLGPEATVMVHQLACREPGCPPAETVVAVVTPGAANRKWTLHAPLGELTDDAVRSALGRPPGEDTDS